MSHGPSPVRLALVGCGRLAEVGYLPAAERTPDVRIVGVADPDPGRRDAVALRCGPATIGAPDLATLLAAANVDGVVLASPAASHVADATRAVEAGAAVLVEKPPAPDAAGAGRLVDLGPSVRVGFNRRYDAGARAVRDAVRSGARAGVELDLAIRYRRASWRPHAVRDDVVADLAPHLFDWARWVGGGEIAEVTAVSVDPDTAVLELTLSTGRARVRAGADRFHAERLVARAHTGAELARHETGGPVAAIADRVRRRGRPHPLVTSLAAQLADFAAAVRGGDAPELGTAGDGLAVMAAIDAARASAASGGRPTPVPDHHPERPPC